MLIQNLKIKLSADSSFEIASSYGIDGFDWRFPIAQPKRNSVSIIGSDSEYDVTESIPGQVPFANVTGTVTLIQKSSSAQIDSFIAKYHGKQVMISHGADTTHYRIGRCYITEDDNNAHKRRIVMTVNAEPYRLSMTEKSVTLSSGTEYALNSSNMVSAGYFTEFTSSSDGYKVRSSIGIDAGTREEKFNLILTGNGDYLLSWNGYTQYNGFCYINIYKKVDGNNVYLMRKENSDTVKLEAGNYFFGIVGTCNGGISALFGIQNFVVQAESGNTVVNAGQKMLIPTYSSDISCTLKCGGYQKHLSAGDSGLLWEFPLITGNNECIVIKDTASSTGNVTLTYREGFL